MKQVFLERTVFEYFESIELPDVAFKENKDLSKGIKLVSEYWVLNFWCIILLLCSIDLSYGNQMS